MNISSSINSSKINCSLFITVKFMLFNNGDCQLFSDVTISLVTWPRDISRFHFNYFQSQKGTSFLIYLSNILHSIKPPWRRLMWFIFPHTTQYGLRPMRQLASQAYTVTTWQTSSRLLPLYPGHFQLQNLLTYILHIYI